MTSLNDAGILQKNISIIGIGNSFRGDDAAGLYIIEYLRERYSDILGPVRDACNINIQLIDASHDPVLAGSIIVEGNPVIIIDAAEMGLEAGSCCVLKISDLKDSVSLRTVSTHGLNISQVLIMAETLGFSENIRIIGIQLDNTGHGDTISQKILSGTDEIVQKILEEVKKLI